jgi:hypothetical protein
MALSGFNHENIRMMESIRLYGFFSFLCVHPLAGPATPKEWCWSAFVMIFSGLARLAGIRIKWTQS